ncbi:MAG: undecaprenyldiphospho-muramoylpentapeptide beta-N-acetylglucosaminyltransferase [Myxococcales bacterium]|nr:undecaprenyldiphospho-muramoylpentapeptide beta-N-acetylglucosaminyltransferase [Myxococcales bacterium]
MIERVMIAGGGTGGHLFPGIAVVEELRRRNPAVEVVFVGTKRGVENRVLSHLGERLEHVEVWPLKGRNWLERSRSLFRLPMACLQAFRLLRRYRPDVVVGVGGYAAGPVVLVAALLRVPTALLEQNATIGLTNRILGKLVKRAYVAFPETTLVFGAKRARVVGNPVRRGFVEAARLADADPDGFSGGHTEVLILGGSQGAQPLNHVVPQALALLNSRQRVSTLRVVHQSGEGMKEEVRNAYQSAGIKAEVVGFIDDIAQAYITSSLVIARAGATTLAELCAIGRPSVLIPYPHASDNHQFTNAKALEKAGASVTVVQSELSPERLADKLRILISSPLERQHMAKKARMLGKPDAAAQIVDDLFGWVKQRAPRPLEPERGHEKTEDCQRLSRARVAVPSAAWQELSHLSYHARPNQSSLALDR